LSVDSSSPANRTGDMPPEEFRTSAHALVDWVADFLEGIDRVPVTTGIVPGEIRRMLPASPPRAGESMAEILADIDRVVMPGMVHWNHPSFFAYFTSSGSGPGILGELLGGALNANSMLWHACPAATELEQVTLDWLRQMLGLPESFWGIIHEGGSTGTLHAIAAAREQLTDLRIRERGLPGRNDVPPLRLYTSELGHSSIEKAVVTLGLGLESVRTVAVDDTFRMQPRELSERIAADRQRGVRPFCVVATVGSTSCTSIDPVAEIAAICEREGLWLHVDAAHGGAAAVVPEMRHVLSGCDRADSIVINPHKWLFVPLDLSVLYCRKREVLRQAFHVVPEYLRTTQGDDVENYMDYGITLGRRFRALKLWFVLRYFGQDGMAARIREHLRLGQTFAGWVDADPRFQRLAPVPLSTICFRACPEGMDEEAERNDLNERLLHAVNGTGRAFLSHTKLGGRYALRLVVSQVRTQEHHLQQVWQLVVETLGSLLRSRAAGR
jgi:aromatic-L-amino-acid decarboxylase